MYVLLVSFYHIVTTHHKDKYSEITDNLCVGKIKYAEVAFSLKREIGYFGSFFPNTSDEYQSVVKVTKVD